MAQADVTSAFALWTNRELWFSCASDRECVSSWRNSPYSSDGVYKRCNKTWPQIASWKLTCNVALIRSGQINGAVESCGFVCQEVSSRVSSRSTAAGLQTVNLTGYVRYFGIVCMHTDMRLNDECSRAIWLPWHEISCNEPHFISTCSLHDNVIDLAVNWLIRPYDTLKNEFISSNNNK
jgi:hypothetical protein